MACPDQGSSLLQDDGAFCVRLAAGYLAESPTWDMAPIDESVHVLEQPEFRIAIPALAGWGPPRWSPDGLEWQAPDATFLLAPVRRPLRPRSTEAWIELRRQQLRAMPEWHVLAGRPLEHPAGLAIEVAEACTVRPRAFRVCRWLFTGSLVLAVGAVTPDLIATRRARELAATFASIRRR